MKTTPLVIVILLCFGQQQAIAQLDSLYTQQWNRDPITNLNSTTSAQRQIITAEQIRVSGYTNLSDVLLLVDGWTFSKEQTDGYNWIMQSNGIENYENQNWVLMLNGQRLEMSRTLGININNLLVSVNNIERIEVINTHGMYLGEFTPNGLINIITKKNSTNGFLAKAFYSKTVQETNLIATIGYSFNKFHINYSLVNVNIPNSKSSYLSPTSYTFAQRTEMQYTGRKMAHQVQFISGLEDFYLLGYLGLCNINAAHQLRLSSTFNAARYLSPSFNQYASTIQHRYQKTGRKGNFTWQNGIGFDYIKKYSYWFGVPDNHVYIIKPFTSINIPITRKVNLFADVQTAFCHHKMAPRVSIGLYKKVSLISNYSFVVGYTETLLEEAFNTAIGQRINALNGASYYYNPKLATADFYYNLNIGSSVKFSFNSGLKNTYDLPGLQYVIFDYPSPNSTIGTYRIFSYPKRSTYQFNWINRFNIHYDIVKNLVFDINYLNTRVLNSWDENLQTIPRHKFTLTLQYEFPKRFTLWTRHYAQSQTQNWNFDHYNDFNYQTSQYDGLYYPSLASYSFDIGLSKKLWKDYLNLNMSMNNMFTRKFAYDNTYDKKTSNKYYQLRISIAANIDGLFAKGNTKP
jgi:hypothetical protein